MSFIEEIMLYFKSCVSALGHPYTMNNQRKWIPDGSLRFIHCYFRNVVFEHWVVVLLPSQLMLWGGEMRPCFPPYLIERERGRHLQQNWWSAAVNTCAGLSEWEAFPSLTYITYDFVGHQERASHCLPFNNFIDGN